MPARAVRSAFHAALLLSSAAAVAAAPADAPKAAPADQHLERGIELAQRGDLAAAEVEVRKSIASAPGNASALAFLGFVLIRQENLDQAIVYLERAVRINPGLTGARFNLALSLFRLGRPGPAREALEIVLRDQPDHRPAALLLGTILWKANDCTRAVKLLEAVKDLAQRQPESVSALVGCYYASNQRAQARAVLAGLTAPGAAPDVSFAGIMASVEARDFEAADTLLNAIRPVHRHVVQFGYLSALVDYNAARFAASQKTLERLTSEGSQDANLFDLLAWSYHRQQNSAEAVLAIERAIQLEPANGMRCAHLAQILHEQQRYVEAYAAAKKAVELAGGEYLPHKIKGDVESAQGLPKQAEASYSRAVASNPRAPEALLLLGVTEHRLWKYPQAKATFEKGIRMFPTTAGFYLAYAKMLLDPGARSAEPQQTAAVELLRKALAIDDSLAEVHYELGKYLVRSGQAAKGLSHLEAAALLTPKNAQVHLALSNAHKILGNPEGAARHLELFKALQAETQ